MTYQENLQILKAKQAHLRDSIAQLKAELEEEEYDLITINTEIANLSKGDK